MPNKEILVEAKIKRWRDVRSGKVEVTSSHVLFYRGNLLGKPELKLRLDVSKISDCRVVDHGSDRVLAIGVEGAQGEKTTETLTLAEPAQAERLHEVLKCFLEQREAKRRAQEEEEAERRKEQEEQAEQAERIRQAYVAGVWASADILWNTATNLYGLVEGARVENWGRARKHYAALWQLTERLKLENGVDAIKGLEDMGESLARENGENAVRKSAAFVDLVSRAFVDPIPPEPEWQKLDAAREGISPNWAHLGCFLLFGLSYGETRLCFETGDWPGLQQSLANLSAASIVLVEWFGIALDESVARLTAAAEKREAGEFQEAARRLEQAMAGSLGNHRRKENSQEKRNGTVS